MRVFVTGGTGTIGAPVIAELLGHGHTVLALSRSDRSADALERAGADVLRGELGDLDVLRAGAAQADGVVSLAFTPNYDTAEGLSAAIAEESAAMDLRAVTGPDYGRMWDHELVTAVMQIAGEGTGDTRWKVPGLLDWSTMTHNPFVEVTKDTTTLYASDRDVFLFLVDDTHPVEAGRLPNGDPDLYFRGFYCWNSEVGSKTLGIASFFLRAVCMNRNIWGAEGLEEISIRHSKFAAGRFAHQAAPALAKFADSSPGAFVAGVKAARGQIVARDDEDRQSFLRKRGFSKPETEKIIATVLDEEGRPPESVFDFVQGITALARARPHQDARLVLEGHAARLMAGVN